MKFIKSSVNYLLLLACMSLSISYSCQARTFISSEITLVASTPGDDEIKSLLPIPRETKVDFIRWNMRLDNSQSTRHTFKLEIFYGESQPNTLGFIGGGEKQSIEGEYSVSKSSGSVNGEVYNFKSRSLPAGISMVKLNDNVFHLLTPQKELMVGNGGWSYSLNRKERVNIADGLPLVTSSSLLDDTSRQVILDGRTPCQEFAAEHRMNVSPSCFKLKWKLILNRDPITHKPTTYTVRKIVDNEPREVVGKWAIIRGLQNNPEAVIYKLDPDDPQGSISLLAGDENVSFFLNKKNELYAGNGDFSFTLNRKR